MLQVLVELASPDVTRLMCIVKKSVYTVVVDQASVSVYKTSETC